LSKEIHIGWASAAPPAAQSGAKNNNNHNNIDNGKVEGTRLNLGTDPLCQKEGNILLGFNSRQHKEVRLVSCVGRSSNKGQDSALLVCLGAGQLKGCWVSFGSQRRGSKVGRLDQRVEVCPTWFYGSVKQERAGRCVRSVHRCQRRRGGDVVWVCLYFKMERRERR
jgi:hypothetical protein